MRTTVYICTLLLSFRYTLSFSKATLLRRNLNIMSSKRSIEATGGDQQPARRQKQDETTNIQRSQSLPFCPADFNAARARLLSNPRTNANLNPTGKCVVLWMSRDQRAIDNHAMHYAQSVAQAYNLPVKVVFNLVPKFLEATIRQYGFMIKGLQEVEQTLRSHGIPLHLLMGDPTANIPAFARQHEAMLVVTDFSPLRVGAGWVKAVAAALDQPEASAAQDTTDAASAPASHSSGRSRASSDSSASPGGPVPLVQVDAHNVVPVWAASPKLEYSARTIRGKISARLAEFLTPQLPLAANPPGQLDCEPVDWAAALASLQIDRTVPEIDSITPGTAAGYQTVDAFIEQRLRRYADKRNDPNADALSGLSPYLHFGQVSAQAAVLRVKASRQAHGGGMDAFIEECVVRRELSDNFCFYNPHYDSLAGLYDWARDTLAAHASDPRPQLYSLAQLEAGNTHDDLWNASQLQLVREGKMHGFLRMYWAKKILEWTASPAQALQHAIFLNDRYSLDGRDPNGYVGCMWSIGGIHDQGWGERAVFGKIRYMNYKGCQRKFNVAQYVARYPPAAANAKQTGLSPY